jgi:hypothetical protein
MATATEAPTIRVVFALRRQLRRVTWIALTAMLALALMPTLSHALSFARGVPSALSEVCTPQGAKLLAPSDPASEPAPALSNLDHCPFCALQGAPALPPAPVPSIGPLGLSHAVPPLFLAAPRPLFAWASAQPRAPPTHS